MEKEWMDALVQVKRMGNLLNEVEDLSQQLAEAVDRDDQVSVELLVNMRREPIEKLIATEQVLEEQAAALADVEERERLSALLGGGPAQAEDEKTLAELVAGNRRRLDQILSLDKVLNQKLTREKSAYL